MTRLHHLCWGLMIAAGLTVGAGSLPASDASGVIRDADWSIEIRSASQSEITDEPTQSPFMLVGYQNQEPAVIGPALPPNAVEPAAPVVTAAPRMSYAEAYRSVPFSRTEYEANPGYRHQAAMEVMFGVLRPMTMIQQYTPKASRYGDTYQVPYGRSDTQHINIRNYGRGYFNGQSPFGYPYGLSGNW